MGRRKHITKYQQKTILSLYSFFEKEWQTKRFLVRQDSLNKRVAAALKISVRTVIRVRNGYQDASAKERTRRKKYDPFTASLIRRRMHRFYADRTLPTLTMLVDALQTEVDGFNLGRSTVWKILKEIGFRYRASEENRKFVYERTDIVAQRHKYLRMIRKYRALGYDVVYVDETWLNQNHTKSHRWTDDNRCGYGYGCTDCGFSCRWKIPDNKGRRLIILHAGSAKLGFVPDCDLVFETKNKEGDYHREMNSTVFMDWFENQLLVSLPHPCVIVLDNASYHNIKLQESITPSSNNRKQEMQDCLTARNIPFTIEMHKTELYEIIKKNKPNIHYKTDYLANKHGHIVLRTPVKHCELNAIGLIWGFCKNYVAVHNKTFKFPDLRSLFKDSIGQVSVELWGRAVSHAQKVEEAMWKLDGLIEEESNPLVIAIGQSSDEADTEEDATSSDSD